MAATHSQTHLSMYFDLYSSQCAGLNNFAGLLLWVPVANTASHHLHFSNPFPPKSITVGYKMPSSSHTFLPTKTLLLPKFPPPTCQSQDVQSKPASQHTSACYRYAPNNRYIIKHHRTSNVSIAALALHMPSLAAA